MTLALIRHVTPLIDRGVCDAAEAARRALDLVPSLLEADAAVIAHGFVLRVIRRSARRSGYGLIYRFCEGCFCVEIWQRAV